VRFRTAHRFVMPIVTGALVVALASCAQLAQKPKPAEAPRPQVSAASASVVQQLIDDVNAARTRQGVARLRLSVDLTTHAATWARRVADGACGIGADGVAKSCHSNLAPLIGSKWSEVDQLVGSATPKSNVDAIVQKFAKTSGHRSVMLDPDSRALGVGAAQAGSTTYAVLTFGSPKKNGNKPATTTTTVPRVSSTTVAPPTTKPATVPATPAPTVPPTVAPPTTKAPATNVPAGVIKAKYTPAEVLPYAYNAGFRTEAQLLAVTGIAIAESSLITQNRNWHPEYGYRPASAVIGVQGPASVWNASHTQQLNSDRGLWQISSRWWPNITDAQADNPASAAVHIFNISNSGRDFSPWDSYVRGNSKSYYDRSVDGYPALRPIVQAFLRSVS
jgi:uncharacterized protein YkwD